MKNKRIMIILACLILILTCALIKYTSGSEKTPPKPDETADTMVNADESTDKVNEPTASTEGSVVKNQDITLYNTKYNELGNTSGNLSNWGYFAEQGNWMYFTLLNKSGDRLYRAMQDGETGLKEVPGVVGANFINVAGEWIYYTTPRSSGIFKVRTDGSDGAILTDRCHRPIVVSRDTVYYVNDSGINRIDVNGTSSTLITSDVVVDALNYSENYIYYIKNVNGSFIPQEDYKLFRIDINGSNRKKLSDDNCLQFIVDGDWIYYINGSDKSKLYRIKKDGTQRKLLIDEPIYNFNILNSTIYYVGTGDFINIYKFKIDTRAKTKLTNNKISALVDSSTEDTVNLIESISTIGDHIFCTAIVNNNRAILRVNLDGSLQKLIN